MWDVADVPPWGYEVEDGAVRIDSAATALVFMLHEGPTPPV